VAGGVDAHFGCIDLLRDRDALMCVGYRAFTPDGSFRHRAMRRLSRSYFGASSGRRDEAGIWLRSGRGKGIAPWIALGATQLLARPRIGRHIFDESLRPYYGSAWFGARRPFIQGMTELFSQPAVHDYFSRLHISEEFLLPTLMMRLGVRRGPMNHFVQRFNEAHTGQIHEEHLAQLRDCGAFFARKFADDPRDPARTKVLRELVSVDAMAQPSVSTAGEGALLQAS
jgi:hypothetical protein